MYVYIYIAAPEGKCVYIRQRTLACVITYTYIIVTCITAMALLHSIREPRAYGGGFLGFQETPFDSKAISKITCQ